MKKIFYIALLIVPILIFAAFRFEVLVIESELVYQAMRYYDSFNNRETVHVIAPVVLFDDFLSDDNYNGDFWDFTGENSGTATSDVSIFTDGAIMLTTGGADNDDNEFSGEIRWYAGYYCAMEAKIANADVSASAFFVGFSSAQTFDSDTIAVMYSTTTITDIDGSDCAGFVYDPDGTDTDYIMGVAVKDGTAGTVVSYSSDAPEDDETFVLRVTIDSDGDCEFWIDGNYVGRTETGITVATALCPYVGYINRETAANEFHVDYI